MLESRARLFATAAHAAIGQVRDYTGEPYINHPARVVDIVRTVSGNTQEMVAAAWLHDVVEDTDVTLELIHEEFGQDVVELVDWLTDTSKPSDGNRVARKAIDRERLSRAPAQAQTIKVADIIDNAGDIMEHDPKFGVVFFTEVDLLLTALTKADAGLLKQARQLLNKEKAK